MAAQEIERLIDPSSTRRRTATPQAEACQRAERVPRHPRQALAPPPSTAKNRIMIFRPKDDGSYVLEFGTSDGEVRSEVAVIRHFQEQMPYGLFVPEVAGE